MSGTISLRMSRAQWLLLFALSVLWGGSFFFVEIALTELAPELIVALRVSLGAVALWCVLFARGGMTVTSTRSCLAFLAMGVLNNAIPFSLIAVGQSHTGSSMAAILNATTPVFTVIVAGVCLRDEPMSRPKIIGAAVGLAGVAVLLAEGATAGESGILPHLAVLGGALSYACAGVFGRRFQGMGVDPVSAAAGQLTASSVLMVAYVAWFQSPDLSAPLPSLGVIVSVLSLALLSTALAYIVYFKLLASAGATNLLLVTLLIPVTAVALSVVALGESLSWRAVSGLLVIATGLSAIDGRIWTAVIVWGRSRTR